MLLGREAGVLPSTSLNKEPKKLLQMMKVEVERARYNIDLELEVMDNLPIPIPICSGYAINIRGDNNINIGQRTIEEKVDDNNCT